MTLVNQALSRLLHLLHFRSRGIYRIGRLTFLMALAVGLGLGLFTGRALAATYMGDGFFSTNELNWRYYNPNSYASYAAPTLSAIYSWDTMTDIDLTEVYDGSWHTLVHIDDWGDTIWAGYAYVCSIGYGCDTQTAWDHTYYYTINRINHYHASGYLFDKRKSLVTHETGHSWSLGHVSDSTSIMQIVWWTVTVPNANDVSHVNARY